MARETMPGRPRELAGATVLIACAQYFVAEAVASSAWREPGYDYLTNYISDLGVEVCTARLCSPRAFVMNAGFVVAGALCIAATVLLADLIRPVVARRLVLLLASFHGIGTVTVGLVQSAPGTAAGTPLLHLGGAYLAILGGNAALLAVGAGARAARSYRTASVALGVVGLASGAALVLTRTSHPGLLERMAADTVPIWEVATGLMLLVRHGNRTRAQFLLPSREREPRRGG